MPASPPRSLIYGFFMDKERGIYEGAPPKNYGSTEQEYKHKKAQSIWIVLHILY